MEQKDILAILFLVVFALVFGGFTARSSNQRAKIHGGAVSMLLNYIASALMTVVLPTVLVLVFVIHPEWTTIGGITFAPIVQVIGTALGLTALAFIVLLIYAVVEKPAQKDTSDEDRGWTEEDARTSGL